MLSDLEASDVHWDPSEGVMSYVPNVCVLAASTLLPNKEFTFLMQSGFLDRFHVVSHEFSDRELSNNLHSHRLLDQESLNELKKINEKLRNIKVSEMKMPTEEFMKPIYDAAEAMVDDEIRENPKLRKEEILNPRMKGDIIRELVAHAFLRTAFSNAFGDIPKLEYTQEDVEFILQRLDHFIEFRLNPLIAEDFTSLRIKKKRPRDQVKERVIGLLSDGGIRGRNDIVSHVKSEMKVSDATIDKVLADLVSIGTLAKPKTGHYKLKGDC